MEVGVLIGGKHEDVRGCLRFCNDFDMGEVKRFYTVANSAAEPKRGWIMHRRETKWFFPLQGVTEVKIRGEDEQWKDCSSFVLSADSPKVLQVPPGNWFCIEQDGMAEVQVFSDCRLGEYENDDYRRPLE